MSRIPIGHNGLLFDVPHAMSWVFKTPLLYAGVASFTDVFAHAMK